MLPPDPDHALHHALTRLPTPLAPHTLLPRVLAVVREWAERPWYQRQWLTWPMGWQIASVGALALIVTLGAWLLPAAGALVNSAAGELPLDRLTPLVNLAERVDRVLASLAAIGGALWSIWRALMLPGVLYGYALLALTAAMCLASASALHKLTFGKVLSR